MEKRKLGTLKEVLSNIWELYINKGATNFSTRRHLRKMECFSETEIFHLMEKLQHTKGQIKAEKRQNDDH